MIHYIKNFPKIRENNSNEEVVINYTKPGVYISIIGL